MLFADFVNNITGILTVTFLFGGWIIVAVVSSVAKNWRKVHESEHLASLKQSMIERGMSADEIERVLRAGPATEDAEGGDATQLSTKLAEHGVPGPDLEQILIAYRTADPGTRKTLSKTVVAMLDNGAESAQILGVIRAFTIPTTNEQPEQRRFTDDAASFRH